MKLRNLLSRIFPEPKEYCPLGWLDYYRWCPGCNWTTTVPSGSICHRCSTPDNQIPVVTAREVKVGGNVIAIDVANGFSASGAVESYKRVYKKDRRTVEFVRKDVKLASTGLMKE